MADRWIYSDLHFDHENIIKYCNRPFANAAEMNEFLIEIHNQYVKTQDRAYNLGDFTMHRGKKWYEWLFNMVQKLNGHKVLYLGNHDHFEAKEYLAAGFEDVRATWRDDQNIVYSHIPIHPSSMGSAVANVHGHTHDQPDEAPVVYKADNKTTIRPYVNVSIERTDYRPLHMDELLQRIRKIQEEYIGKDSTIQDEK